MSLALDRYCHRKRIRFRCTVITPMFLGNADQDAEWRAALEIPRAESHTNLREERMRC